MRSLSQRVMPILLCAWPALFPSSASGASIISVIAAMAKCPSGTPAIITWDGSRFACTSLGPGISITGGAIVVSMTSVWQVEPVSLATLAAGSTSITYTTLKAPVTGGAIFWWYNYATPPADPLNSGVKSGLFLYGSTTPNPITITLPSNWSGADTILIAYQSQ